MLNSEDFERAMNALGVTWDGVSDIAVAVSGGPDSVALHTMLSEWAQTRGISLHALHVDHGLRAESGEQARELKAHIPDLQVLTWDGDKPDAALQEAARHARYDLMRVYCDKSMISHLFLGHHRDDQAETVLFRLAKGSGLDGLCGMNTVQDMSGLTLLRPLLDFSKDELMEYCSAHDLFTVHDRSNDDDKYARVRLRQSMDILAQEGLTAKRLSVTAKRLARARVALEELSQNAYDGAILNKNTKHIVFNFKILKNNPEEIIVRCVLMAISTLVPCTDYAPRMERVEVLVNDLISEENFRKRTLGGLVFARDDEKDHVLIALEKG